VPEIRNLKSKLLRDENGLKTFVLVFDKDEEAKESLMRFASETGSEERKSRPLGLSAR